MPPRAAPTHPRGGATKRLMVLRRPASSAKAPRFSQPAQGPDGVFVGDPCRLLAPPRRGPVRVASDCSGWCTEIMAARSLLTTPATHVFCSDNNQSVKGGGGARGGGGGGGGGEILRPRKLITSFMRPERFYDDISARDNRDAPGNLDCYVAGFPCQAFSVAGQRAGEADPRGQIAYFVIDYIAQHFPRCFILENVRGLVTADGGTFERLVGILRSLPARDGPAYEVHWAVLRTDVHGGLPQHRQRVYIVGLLRAALQRPFSWPPPAGRVRDLKDILSDEMGSLADLPKANTQSLLNLTEMLTALERKGGDLRDEYIVDIGGTKMHMMKDLCPCLTASRASARGFWSSRRFRVLTTQEMMALQGVDPEMFPGWEQVISAAQMGKICGNAMSLCVLERVMRAAFVALGILVKADRWA